MDIGEALRDKMNPWFGDNYGIQLTDFVVENISLPPEVEKMLDKRTSMGLVGDMGAFTQFQAANAMETAGYNRHFGEFNTALTRPLTTGIDDVVHTVQATATCAPRQNTRAAFAP